MYRLIFRKLLATIVVSALTLSPQLWACGDVAVISRDARFLVLDGDTLAVKDVGNLWWLGFRVIDGVVAGSTLDLALINVERVVDLGTGSLRDDEYGRRGGRFRLRNLEREGKTPLSGIPSLVRSGDSLDMKWVTGGDAQYLLEVSGLGGNRQIRILDTSLNVLGRWPSPEPSIGVVATCVDASGRVVIGGLDSRAIIEQGQLRMEDMEKANRSTGYRLSYISLGCKALMGKANGNETPITYATAMIDLAQNRVISEFPSSVSYGRQLLFADAKRLLQQEVIATPVPDTPGFKVEPTSTFRVIDTSNGTVVLRKTANVMPGAIHEQLLCQGESERIVIQSPKAIHLLGLNTLEIIASRDVPFDQYFVLGSAAEAALSKGR